MNYSSTAEQQPDTGIPRFDWINVTCAIKSAHFEHALLAMDGGIHTTRIGIKVNIFSQLHGNYRLQRIEMNTYTLVTILLKC